MKLIIDIPEREYKVICENNYVAVCACPNLLSNAIKNGTPIPDNATNDDVLIAIFNERAYRAVHDRMLGTMWLFATYQKGGKDDK